MRVLVVEDEPIMAESIAAALSRANMIPTLVGNGIHAVSMLEQAKRGQRPYDAVLLDLTLPGMDGMDVLRSMRAKRDMTPVMVLTARVTLADRVDGLETGADDYLAKPFADNEMLARLRAISRRRVEPESTQLQVGNLALDTSRGVFLVDGAVLTLPRVPHAMLEALIRRRGLPVPKEFLMNLDEVGNTSQAVDTALSRLRQRLRSAGAEVTIETAHYVGYVLKAK